MSDTRNENTPVEVSGNDLGATYSGDGYSPTTEPSEALTDAPLNAADEDAKRLTSDLRSPEDSEGDTFPRSYVEKLRRESQGLRDRLKEAEDAQGRADDYAKRLHSALVAQDGRLVDVEALPFAVEHLESPEALEAAVSELLQRKPYLSAKRFTTPLPQGATGTSSAGSVSFLEMMSART